MTMTVLNRKTFNEESESVNKGIANQLDKWGLTSHI
jgi:hypothetical protein